MPVYSVVLQARYEVIAEDQMQAQLAAAAAASGCKTDEDRMGERRRILGCIVTPEGSTFESTTERKTFDQIKAETEAGKGADDELTDSNS